MTGKTLREKLEEAAVLMPKVQPTTACADDAQAAADAELCGNVSKMIDALAEFIGAVVQVELTKHRSGFGVDQARYHAARTEAVRLVVETIMAEENETL